MPIVLASVSGACVIPLGIVVRDCASFGLDGVVRIAVPDADGLARLEHALTALE